VSGPAEPAAAAGVSVVVPTYRGAETLEALAEGVEAALRPLGGPFELILVEDESPDDGATWAVVARLAADRDWVRGLRLLRNRGQHNALLAGLRAARHPVVVTMDDDLQNPPDEIPALVAALEAQGVDVVYGVPRRRGPGLAQSLGGLLVRRALALGLGVAHARHVSSFRAFRAGLGASFSAHSSPRVNVDALLTWGTTRFGHVVVEHAHRRTGRSGYTLRKLIAHAVDMITGYSTAPLRFASAVGFAFFLFGAGVLVFTVVGRLVGFIDVPGFAFTISLISILGGSQLLTLGIFGEYLARIYLRSLDIPSYTVAERVGEPAAPAPGDAAAPPE